MNYNIIWDMLKDFNEKFKGETRLKYGKKIKPNSLLSPNKRYKSVLSGAWVTLSFIVFNVALYSLWNFRRDTIELKTN